VIERSFNTIKNWRGIATRYDKLAITCRAAALLPAICAWLRHFKETRPSNVGLSKWIIAVVGFRRGDNEPLFGTRRQTEFSREGS
jgi:hypothetical protein